MKGNPYKFNVVQRNAALVLFAAGWTQDDIASALGIRRQTIFYAVKKDPVYALAVHKAIDTKDAEVEAALFQSAVHSKNVIAQIFWLKNRHPEKWRDVSEQKVENRSVVLEVHYDANRQPSQL